MAGSVIVKSSLETAMKYCSLVSAKVSGRRRRVLFEVNVDDYSIADAVNSAKTNKNIAVLVYEGIGVGLSSISSQALKGSDINITWLCTVAGDVTEQDLQGYLSELPDGMTLTLKFPEDYVNYDLIFSIMEKYPKVRVCGSTLFAFDDFRVGLVGKDIIRSRGADFDASNYLVSGECNAAPTVYEEDIVLENIGVSGGKGTKKAKTSKKTSNGEGKARKQKVQKFSSFLFASGHHEL